MSPIFPDCYDQWELLRRVREDDVLVYDTIYEGTEEQCREYARENLTRDEHEVIVLMDWEGREWEV